MWLVLIKIININHVNVLLKRVVISNFKIKSFFSELLILY